MRFRGFGMKDAGSGFSVRGLVLRLAVGFRGKGVYLTDGIHQLVLESQLPHKIVDLIS